MKIKLQLIRNIIQAYIIGFPTPYGFRLRVKALSFFNRLSTDYSTLKAKYDAQVLINTQLSSQLTDLDSRAREMHKDAKELSVALKELVNHPNVISPTTQSIIDTFKVQ